MADPRIKEQADRIADMIVFNRLADDVVRQGRGTGSAYAGTMPNYAAEMAEAQAWGAPGPVYQASGAHMMMPGAREAAAQGIPPPLIQRDPYATATVRVFPFGDQMGVQNLVGYPSWPPHVLRGYGEDFTRVAPYLGMMGMMYPWAMYGPPPMPNMPRGGWGYGGGAGGAARASANAGTPAVKNEAPAKPAGVDLQPILDLVNGIVPQRAAPDLGPNVRFGEFNPVPPKAPAVDASGIIGDAMAKAAAASALYTATNLEPQVTPETASAFAAMGASNIYDYARKAAAAPPPPGPVPEFDWGPVIDATGTLLQPPVASPDIGDAVLQANAAAAGFTTPAANAAGISPMVPVGASDLLPRQANVSYQQRFAPMPPNESLPMSAPVTPQMPEPVVPVGASDLLPRQAIGYPQRTTAPSDAVASPEPLSPIGVSDTFPRQADAANQALPINARPSAPAVSTPSSVENVLMQYPWIQYQPQRFIPTPGGISPDDVMLRTGNITTPSAPQAPTAPVGGELGLPIMDMLLGAPLRQPVSQSPAAPVGGELALPIMNMMLGAPLQQPTPSSVEQPVGGSAALPILDMAFAAPYRQATADASEEALAAHRAAQAQREQDRVDALRAFLNYYIPYEAMIRAGKATARDIRNRGKKRRR